MLYFPQELQDSGLLEEPEVQRADTPSWSQMRHLFPLRSFLLSWKIFLWFPLIRIHCTFEKPDPSLPFPVPRGEGCACLNRLAKQSN